MDAGDKTSTLQQRLDFIEIDEVARSRLHGMQPIIGPLVGGALDKLYRKIADTPAVARFFPEKSHIGRARKAQENHWANLAGGNFDESYVNGVVAVGRAHARIGLEPR